VDCRRAEADPAPLVYRNLETQVVTREQIEALVARERPGWRVVDVNDESGLSFKVVEGGETA
jgi:hypothetical protein